MKGAKPAPSWFYGRSGSPVQSGFDRTLDADGDAIYLSPELNRPDGAVMTKRMHPADSRNASRRLFETAHPMAAREGTVKITIEAIAKNAGLSKGGVLYNYPMKKALLSGLLDQMLAEHRKMLTRVRERHPLRTYLSISERSCIRKTGMMSSPWRDSRPLHRVRKCSIRSRLICLATLSVSYTTCKTLRVPWLLSWPSGECGFKGF